MKSRLKLLMALVLTVPTAFWVLGSTQYSIKSELMGQWACEGFNRTNVTKLTFDEDGGFTLFAPLDERVGVFSSSLLRGSWESSSADSGINLTVSSLSTPSKKFKSYLVDRLVYDSSWRILSIDNDRFEAVVGLTPAFDARRQSKLDYIGSVSCHALKYQPQTQVAKL